MHDEGGNRPRNLQAPPRQIPLRQLRHHRQQQETARHREQKRRQHPILHEIPRRPGQKAKHKQHQSPGRNQGRGPAKGLHGLIGM